MTEVTYADGGYNVVHLGRGKAMVGLIATVASTGVTITTGFKRITGIGYGVIDTAVDANTQLHAFAISGGTVTVYTGSADVGGISAVVPTVTGTTTLAASGTFTGTTDISYKVEIDADAVPDTFKWSDDGGSTWDATTVNVTGGAQTLNNGVSVTFSSTTNADLGDSWTFTGSAATAISGTTHLIIIGDLF